MNYGETGTPALSPVLVNQRDPYVIREYHELRGGWEVNQRKQDVIREW